MKNYSKKACIAQPLLGPFSTIYHNTLTVSFFLCLNSLFIFFVVFCSAAHRTVSFLGDYLVIFHIFCEMVDPFFAHYQIRERVLPHIHPFNLGRPRSFAFNSATTTLKCGKS